MTEPTRLSAALADRYRVERELGQGGMATVYLARDLKHDRDVAIKVLHPDLGAALGSERFLSEIKTTARLQHPHILPLLDSGEADGLLYYVMPVVTGETLRTRLERERQLPIAEAVRIAREVASALDYAHRQNVIHRDIKPENILLHEGQALVADFGIALAVQQAGGQRMTQTGLSLGTPQYMSPEQAMGERTIDARSDIYALGAVTYEMLAGDAPFTGGSVQTIVAKVMNERPTPLHTIRDTVPANVEQAVLTALAKLPADRFATAGEFAAALVNPNTPGTMGNSTPVASRRSRRLGVAAAVVVGLLGLAGGYLLGTRTSSAPASGGDAIRTSLTLGDSAAVRARGNLRLAISPQGTTIAYGGVSGDGDAIWVRQTNARGPRMLGDTKGGFGPFFSPDGQYVGFFVNEGSTTSMKVASIAGGAVRTVVEDSAADFGGASWGDDGNIYYTSNARSLSRVAATGGAITRVTRVDSSSVLEHDFPDVLPGSRHAVVMLWKGGIAVNRIGLVDLSSGKVTDIGPGTMARFAAPGLIAIGMASGHVMIAPLDVKAKRFTATPELLQEDVQREYSNGTLQFAISHAGSFVFQPGATSSDRLVWVDRAGVTTAIDTSMKGIFGAVALSPDARRIAVTHSAPSGSTEVWMKELATGAYSRLSLDIATSDRPAWTPDGRSVAFLGTRDNRRTAWVARYDGSDNVQPLLPGRPKLDEVTFDPQGRYILLRSEGVGPGTRRLMVVEKGVDTMPRVLIKSPFDHYSMTLSPDGRWLAYVSDESSRGEVYVRPFPNVDSARFAISAGGGIAPAWSRDGKELFFRTARGGVFVVSVTTGATFTNGTPKLLFASTMFGYDDKHRLYDVHPDGQHFLMVESRGQDTPRLEMVFNWPAEFQKLKRARK